MIIGHGDIASALPQRDDLLFFASGVSNSQEKRESEYRREMNLLLKQDRQAHIVYFSSLAVFYGKNRYVKHKREIESLIKQEFPRYTIVRIGNITWGTNPHTLINYLRNQIKAGKTLKIQHTYRYIIDKDELQHWINKIPRWSCELNITGQRMSIKEVVNKYVYLGLPNKKI